MICNDCGNKVLGVNICVNCDFGWCCCICQTCQNCNKLYNDELVEKNICNCFECEICYERYDIKEKNTVSTVNGEDTNEMNICNFCLKNNTYTEMFYFKKDKIIKREEKVKNER